MALPVVSFSSDGVREAVVHGETGLLAPERDVEALADHLSGLWADPNRCAKMGQTARAHVCAHFNLRIQTRTLEQLYRRALGKDKAQQIFQSPAESDDEGPIETLVSQR
jgi:colanic acid/amylovoran biosynthesis glycosyltransferase